MAQFKYRNIFLNYEYIKNENSHRTVVLLNGIMMNTKAWSNTAKIISTKYNVLLTDFKGQGDSSKPNIPYSYEQHLEELNALFDFLNLDHFHIVGTSYGSEIGMYYASENPEKVLSLTVAAGVSFADNLLLSKVESWKIAAKHALEYQAKSDFYTLVMPLNYSNEYISKNKLLFDKQKKYYTEKDDEWYLAFIRLCECFQTLSITDKLPKISCHTLLIAADKDELKPLSYMKLMNEKIKNSELHIIDAGHALVIEKFEIFNELVLKFLDRF